MILTNKQEEGLKIAVDRYKAREPWTCIAGYAGVFSWCLGKEEKINLILNSSVTLAEQNFGQN